MIEQLKGRSLLVISLKLKLKLNPETLPLSEHRSDVIQGTATLPMTILPKN